MGLKEDILEMKKECCDLKNKNQEQSLAMELLRDSKRANKRICFSFGIVLLVTLILWFATICYLVYVLNDIGIEETTTTETYDITQDSGDGGNNNFINGSNNEVHN